MNILVVSRGIPDSKNPLSGIFEFDQAKALASIGHNVMFLALDFRAIRIRRKWGIYAYKKDGVDVCKLSIPIGRYRKSMPILQFFALLAFRYIVRRNTMPDIIHSHFFHITTIATVFKRKYNIPLVYTEHSSFLNGEPTKIDKLNHKLLKYALNNSDSVISVSRSLSDNIKKIYGQDSSIIHNIVDTSSFKFVERNRKSNFHFLSIGLLIERKRFDLLIEAFIKADFNDNVYLSIIGDGSERESLQSLIDKNNMASRIRLLGQKNRSEIQEEMSKSDAFVLASKGETFGVVYIEAMLSGLPVIATICGGPENYISENEGILIHTDNLDELTTALKTMYDKAYTYNAFAISEKCKSEFSPKTIARKITDIYKYSLNKATP